MDRHRRWVALSSGFLIFWLSGVALATDPAKVTLNVGIVPQQSPSRLAKLWTPILMYLSEKTGYTLRFKTSKDIPMFEQRLARGEYDVTYMNPYHYTVFSVRPGYRAFAKEQDTKLQGVIVVHKKSSIQTIRDLDGQTLAFPAPAAFAATVIPLVQLQRQGVRVTPKYLASHDSVYKAVAKRIYAGGGGVVRTLSSVDTTVRDELRVLWRTDRYTPHPFAHHPRVPGEVVARLAAAMRAMGEDSRGRRLLNGINFSGIVAATDDEYDDIRALRLSWPAAAPTPR